MVFRPRDALAVQAQATRHTSTTQLSTAARPPLTVPSAGGYQPTTPTPQLFDMPVPDMVKAYGVALLSMLAGEWAGWGHGRERKSLISACFPASSPDGGRGTERMRSDCAAGTQANARQSATLPPPSCPLQSFAGAAVVHNMYKPDLVRRGVWCVVVGLCHVQQPPPH